MKHIKLFEAFGSNSMVLSPEDIGTTNDVVVTIKGDGIYAALLSKAEGQSLFDLLQNSLNKGYIEDVQMNSGKNAAYAYVNSNSDFGIEIEGPEFEKKTPEIAHWINSESDWIKNKYKENPNWSSAQEEESIVMTLRKGYVTYTEPNGHSIADGQEPLEDFIKRFIG
jgi:hypothetical protein